MEIKTLSGILNHVNATILEQTRALLEKDLATSDKRRRQIIWYMWSNWRDQAMLAEQTSKMIEKMVKEQKERDAKMAKGDDIFDSSTYITMKPSVDMRIKRPEDFAAIFGTTITPESETSGVSKIAAGISMGQLEKSKF